MWRQFCMSWFSSFWKGKEQGPLFPRWPSDYNLESQDKMSLTMATNGVPRKIHVTTKRKQNRKKKNTAASPLSLRRIVVPKAAAVRSVIITVVFIFVNLATVVWVITGLLLLKAVVCVIASAKRWVKGTFGEGIESWVQKNSMLYQNKVYNLQFADQNRPPPTLCCHAPSRMLLFLLCQDYIGYTTETQGSQRVTAFPWEMATLSTVVADWTRRLEAKQMS